MIQSYEIKKVNGKDILYINLNFDQEFARLNARKKKKKLKTIINDFIKENKIDFAGKTVAILVSGVLIGTILLDSNVKVNDTFVDPVQTIYAVKDFNDSNAKIESDIQDELPILKEDVAQEKDDKKEIIENKTTVKKETVQNKKANNSGTNKKTTSPVTSTVPKTPVKSSDTQKEVPKENVENKTYVTINRANGNVLKIELEEYVIGVVSAEMPAAFNVEALKAQSILARTYALKSTSKGIKLTDNSSTQNYKDSNELKNLWGSNYTIYYNKIKNAVNATKGMYLTYNGEYIEAVYHSTSNGQTENAKNVWRNAFPYLVSVSSPYDSSNKSFNNTKIFSYSDISVKLGVEVTKDTIIKVESRTEGNRVGIISIGDKKFTGVEVRTLLGLRSADFTIELLESRINITTKGFGHGVGMSQYGANGMANNGSNYTQILKHYYPRVTLSKL